MNLDKYFEKTGLIKEVDGVNIQLEAALIIKYLLAIKHGGRLSAEEVADIMVLVSKLMVAYCNFEVLVVTVGKETTANVMREWLDTEVKKDPDWDPEEHMDSIISSEAWTNE
jgi:proteasome assembly chaperone (PAC2) family protein